ncbi:MAG: hypothetical protein SCK70_03755, partial [bacterium]|nr:hypothetical protein [bacterium]
MKKLKLFLILIVLLVSKIDQATGQNEVYLKIQSEGYQPINLFIASFESGHQAELFEQVRQVILNDLLFSGYFRLTDMTTNDVVSSGNEPIQTTPGSMEALVEAKFETVKNVIQARVRLSELSTKKLIFHKKFEEQIQRTRFLAHKISDELVYHLIGVRGIATTQIVFVTQNSNIKELAVFDYDGFGFRKLTSLNSLNLSPRWSPDGKMIAFTSYVNANPDLLLLNLKDGKLFNVSNQKGLNTSPSWSPDGKKIALTMTIDGNPEIYTLELNNKRWNRLTNNLAIDSSPSWSPDGREIVFTSDRSGTPQLYLMNAEGGNVR